MSGLIHRAFFNHYSLSLRLFFFKIFRITVISSRDTPEALEAIDNDLASYHGLCSAEYDDGVRRLRSRWATKVRWETTHFSSSERERDFVSLPSGNSSPFFARIVRSESIWSVILPENYCCQISWFMGFVTIYTRHKRLRTFWHK